MHIKSKSDKDKAVIYLSGELDECCAEKTRTELDEIISKNLGVKRIIINFSEINFMDSTGIGVLLGRSKRLKKHGILSYISNPSFSVDKILHISGIYEIMPKI